MISGGEEFINIGFMLIDTHRKEIYIIMWGLVLPNRFEPWSSSFTVSHVTNSHTVT